MRESQHDCGAGLGGGVHFNLLESCSSHIHAGTAGSPPRRARVRSAKERSVIKRAFGRAFGQQNALLMLDGGCKPSFQPLSAPRWRTSQFLATMRDSPTAGKIVDNLLPQVGLSHADQQIHPLPQQLRIAVLLTGQLRSLPSSKMRDNFRTALNFIQKHVLLHVIASVELSSGPPTKTDAKQKLSDAGGSKSRWRWIGSRYSEAETRALLAEWGVPFRLALVPTTAAGLAHNVSRLMQRFVRALNASAIMAFDPHENNPELATQWWKLALAFEELLKVETEVGTPFHYVLKVRPDVCAHGLLRFGNQTLAMLRREPHIAWLNLDYLALIPRYAAAYYFRWAMLQCINGRFAPPEHGPRPNDLQSSMAASGVPVVEVSYKNKRAAGPNGTRAHMVALLRGCIVRIISQRRPSEPTGPATWASAAALQASRGVTTCAWVPQALWAAQPGSRGCAPMRCQ